MKQTKKNQIDLRPERKRLGVGLFNLAVEVSRLPAMPAQKVIEQRIKTMKRRRKSVDGKSGLRHLRQQVEFVSASMIRNRNLREVARLPRGQRLFGAVSPGRKPVLLDQRPFEERLRNRVEKSILHAFRTLYRYDEAGRMDAKITKDPAQVGVRQSEYLDWDFYSKGTRYPKKIVNTTITVPNAWRIRVLKQGLAEVDGLLTLDAQRLEGAPAGVELFAAVWVEQGRGYALYTRHGYIARNSAIGVAYHADSIDRAIKGLSRKTGLKEADRQIQDLLAKHGIDAVVARNPGLTVTLQDARAMGACEFGIQSWCYRTGLPYEAGKAPLGEVYAAYKQAPLPEARAAILHALRRQKKAVLKAA